MNLFSSSKEQNNLGLHGTSTVVSMHALAGSSGESGSPHSFQNKIHSRTNSDAGPHALALHTTVVQLYMYFPTCTAVHCTCICTHYHAVDSQSVTVMKLLFAAGHTPISRPAPLTTRTLIMHPASCRPVGVDAALPVAVVLATQYQYYRTVQSSSGVH